MTSLSSFKSPATYHLLSYGTLIGSTLFQSFIGGVVAFRALPRPQFSALQKNIFPAYFTLQTLTPLAMWITYPRSLISALTSTTNHVADSETANDKLNAYLISTMLATALLNLAYVGPQTTKVMGLRKHQETRDGKKSYDVGPHSVEMQNLNRKFGTLHGISTLVNLGGFAAMIWYGAILGEALKL
ncbi:hypothetical protein GQ44DRAFT_632099 [Phaeosphaeriaceae sp. PMI808]|nr:hypothetical protein GQ44DRAFT_632099 [Phaeosphaeriaceae sp. PMI808]